MDATAAALASAARLGSGNRWPSGESTLAVPSNTGVPAAAASTLNGATAAPEVLGSAGVALANSVPQSSSSSSTAAVATAGAVSWCPLPRWSSVPVVDCSADEGGTVSTPETAPNGGSAGCSM